MMVFKVGLFFAVHVLCRSISQPISKDITMISEMESNISCKIPELKVMLKEGKENYLIPCNIKMPNESYIEYALMHDFNAVLCVTLFDIYERLCTFDDISQVMLNHSSSNPDAIFRTFKQDKFCKTMKPIPVNNASVRAVWLNSFNRHIRNESRCERECVNDGSLNKLCGFIHWGNDELDGLQQKGKSPLKSVLSGKKSVDNGSKERSKISINTNPPQIIKESQPIAQYVQEHTKVASNTELSPLNNANTLTAVPKDQTASEGPIPNQYNDSKGEQLTSVNSPEEIGTENRETQNFMENSIPPHTPVKNNLASGEVVPKKSDLDGVSVADFPDDTNISGSTVTDKQPDQNISNNRPPQNNGGSSYYVDEVAEQENTSDGTEFEVPNNENVEEKSNKVQDGQINIDDTVLSDSATKRGDQGPNTGQGVNNTNNKIINDGKETENVQMPPLTEKKVENEENIYDENQITQKAAESNHYIPGRFVDAEDSHFFAYFMTMVVLCIIGYLVFHNKQKILALAVEGRSRKGARRRPNTAGYRKLDSNLEEAVTSKCSTSVTHVIY